MQHKKRGRPRLRDEREPRYEGAGLNYPPPPEMRRPLSLYNPSNAGTHLSFDNLQRASSHRVLKSQAPGHLGGPIAPRYHEQPSPLDTNLYGPSINSRFPASLEPACAYIRMDMQIVKATPRFGEVTGIQSVVSRNLQDIVIASDRDKVIRLQGLLNNERQERDLNYLPPIVVKHEEDRVIQSVGFGPEVTNHFRTDRPETLSFQSPDGQQRAFLVQLNLAKRDSTYFIILMIHVQPTPTPQVYPQASYSPYPRDSQSRESQYGYATSQQGFPQTPAASPFMPSPSFADPRNDMTYRPPLGQVGPSSAVASSFQQAQAKPEYFQGQAPYQTPRSELPQAQPQRQHDLQLPPIRDQRNDVQPVDPRLRRDDRSSRVDIGGLLENPEPNQRRG